MHSLNLSKPLDLRGRRIFVTGGTGFLGRSLLDYLLEAATLHDGAPDVTVLSRSPEKFLKSFPEYSGISWLNFVEGDLTKLPKVNSGEYTDVVHGAADTHSQTDSLSWLSQLTEGTKNILDFAREADAKRFLFISSGAVYGAQRADTSSFSEDDPFAPNPTDIASTYGNGKRIAEHLCALYSAQLAGPACMIARCFAIVSKHIPLDGPYALGNFIRDALADKTITISGDGQTIRSYIHGRDIAHWLFTILDKGVQGQAYNVGSDQPISMLQLATAIRDIVNAKLPLQVLGKSETRARSTYLPSIQKAAELGLSIEVPLHKAIKEVVAHGIQKLGSDKQLLVHAL